MSSDLSAFDRWRLAFRQWLLDANAGKYAPLEMSMELYQASCALERESKTEETVEQ